MVRSYYIVASLALAIAVQAGPIVQRQDDGPAPEEVFGVGPAESGVDDSTPTLPSQPADFPIIDIPADTATSSLVPIETFPPKVCDRKLPIIPRYRPA